MPPPEAGASAPAPVENGDAGGGNAEQLIQQIDKMLGALAAAAGPAGAPLEAVRDAFQAAIEEMMAGAGGGGKQPAAGPTTPEQGGAPNVRPAGP